MADFTLSIYKKLIEVLQDSGVVFLTIKQFFSSDVTSSLSDSIVIMRHDVDRKPSNAVRMAYIENELGISATYYFRSVPSSWDKKSIDTIASLGHEIGYHYEDLAIKKGNKLEAISHFSQQLERFRKLYPVSTICMHGSPLSKWDNRTLWETYNYRDYGINAEPYFDVDYNEVFYITDTGRQWNNETSSVRDRVTSKFDIKINDTFDLIKKIKNNELPPKIMINTHPHRWFDFSFGWINEFIMQNLKNIIKKIIVTRNE